MPLNSFATWILWHTTERAKERKNVEIYTKIYIFCALSSLSHVDLRNFHGGSEKNICALFKKILLMGVCVFMCGSKSICCYHNKHGKYFFLPQEFFRSQKHIHILHISLCFSPTLGWQAAAAIYKMKILSMLWWNHGTLTVAE